MAPAVARLLFLTLAVASSLAVGADALRSLGVGDGATAQGDYAVELDATTFDAFLTASRESFAVVEFFAHWCPACRNYKPHYEKVAKLFNGPDAAHPGRILMARIDCASKVNIDLCNRFSVDHYPFLLWGPPPKFANTKWDRKQEKSKLKLIDDGRTDERLLKWINKQMESLFTLDDKKYENESMLPNNVSYPKQVVQAIYNVAEATAHALQIIF
ncbi:sulfhydryl oxidase 1-like isoform X1 [Triticum dicoccoides]|uniref:sulfhydryl oxidase 1-like isoform X1 n=1 Tax=Triticum dicoccoides TaxID=85692 RepID=UPI0018908919|nr:sulfhydryl oxidase 1-like isoform X1 [Triticum dicoccoides]